MKKLKTYKIFEGGLNTIKCPKCDGTGEETGGSECELCNGLGLVTKPKSYKNKNDTIPIGTDEDVEAKIDVVLNKLLEKKVMISMLANTIDHVCGEVKKTLPLYIDEFLNDLNEYDEKVHDSVDKINDLLLDGFPNVKDMIEDVEREMEELQSYMKLKKK